MGGRIVVEIELMMIARYDPGTFALLEVITSFARFKEVFPRSWVNPVTDEHLIGNGVPARVVSETAPPALSYGERANFTAERQPDESWLQVWSVESISLADAKRDLLSKADGILASRVPNLSDVLHRLFGELQAAEAEQAAGGTPVAARYPMIDAIAQDRSITLNQAAANVVVPLRDAWRNRANQFTARYVTVVEDIKNASTIAAAKAIFDTLDAIE